MSHRVGQHLNLLLGNLRILILNHLPHGLHHSNKVTLIRQAHRQVSVVVKPLVPSDLAIIVALHAVETVKELLDDLLTSQASLNKVRILRHIIDGIDILNGDLSTSILVHQ